MTPFRNEKNSNWEGAYRVPCMVRWPGKIKPGTVSNEIVSHLDWLPTLAGHRPATPRSRRSCSRATRSADMTYKVHLDGYNLVPYLTGPGREEPARVVPLLQRRPAAHRPALRQLEARVHGAASRGHPADLGRAVRHACACRRSSTCGLDPYERADITSNTYYDWLIDHVFLLVPAQDYVGKFLMTFKEYPQRQKAASFNLDEVMRKLQEGAGSK